MLDDNKERTTDTQIDVSIASDPLAGALSKWYSRGALCCKELIARKTAPHVDKKWRGFHNHPPRKANLLA